MPEAKKIRVAVNGYGVIGKRVADAVVRQSDMTLAGVCNVITDWRARLVSRHAFALFGATGEHADQMRAAGLDVAGTLDDLLDQTDVVVDCTPKHIAAKNLFQLGASVLMPAGTRVHGATSRFVFVIPVSWTITPTVPAVTEQVHRDETDEDQ